MEKKNTVEHAIRICLQDLERNKIASTGSNIPTKWNKEKGKTGLGSRRYS